MRSRRRISVADMFPYDVGHGGADVSPGLVRRTCFGFLCVRISVSREVLPSREQIYVVASTEDVSGSLCFIRRFTSSILSFSSVTPLSWPFTEPS